MRGGIRIIGIIWLLWVTNVSWGATPKRIILLETISVPVVLEHTRWFRTEMAEMGYEEGKTLDLTILKAEGDAQKAEALLKESLKQNPPDLVVSNATLASKVAYQILMGSTTPLLFFNVSSPVQAGLIQKVGKVTGNNVTGVVHSISRETKINLAFRVVGTVVEHRPIRFGYVHSTYPSATGDVKILKTMAERNADYEFVFYEMEYKKGSEGTKSMMQEARKGIQKLENQVDFWWEPLDAMVEQFNYIKMITDHSTKPILYGNKPESVKMGALMHMTPDLESSGRQAAILANQIFNGKSPGEIPPVPPDQFQFGVNLTTALKLNIVFPSDVLEMVGENIYR